MPTLPPVFTGNPNLKWLLDAAILEGRKIRIVPIKEEWSVCPRSPCVSLYPGDGNHFLGNVKPNLANVPKTKDIRAF
jgi:hypothetical protein